MIIQIRGTSGSGKTYIVRQLFERYKFKQMKTNSGEIVGYYCKSINLFVVGKYTVGCGGCDTVPTQDEICRRVAVAVKKGWNVLFEGLICSHIAARYAEMYHKYNSEARFIFLDTPLKKCVKNITKRRAERGADTDKVAKNVEKDYTSTHRSRENMIAAGVLEEHAPVLNSKESLEFIIQTLEEIDN